MSEHRIEAIVIERPRTGGRIKSPKGEKKALEKLTREASIDGLLCPYLHKRGRYRTKYFSDNLSPLRRWLRSQVGRPWDEVYSQLCRRLDTRTLSGQHIFSHVWDYVERYVVFVDGIPYSKEDTRYPLVKTYRYERDRFYVHPESGILCQVKALPPKRKSKPEVSDRIRLDAFREYRQIEGIWYEITFRPFPALQIPFDLLLKVQLARKQARGTYGKLVYAARKRQCGKKELKWIRQHLQMEP